MKNLTTNTAYLIRLAPRYVKPGSTSRRGTLIDPAMAHSGQWEADQRDFYKTVVASGKAPPPSITVEFGQPPVEFSESLDAQIGALVVFVMGAESSQGSDNERGLLGVGRIKTATRTNTNIGASMRVSLTVEDVLFASPLVTTSQARSSKYFEKSGLWEQTVFGWEGAPSAQNCYRLFDKSSKDLAGRVQPILATLAIMCDANAEFAQGLHELYPDLYAGSKGIVPDTISQEALSTSHQTPIDHSHKFVDTPIDPQQVSHFLAGRGFTYEPWQVGAFIAAVKVKPFLILAGISGTGKTQLPILVAEATGAECCTVSVRPDWTDSADLLGYHDLSGRFIPGHLLRFAAQAMSEPERQHVFILDEMNIARVEYYFAEVLSCMERRDADGNSAPLLPNAGQAEGVDFSEVVLPANLCLVGSVNVDETTFSFSRKVLDRAFVLELSDVDLSVLQKPSLTAADDVVLYPSSSWQGERIGLAGRTDHGTDLAVRALAALIEMNTLLISARLDVGFRLRDEFVAIVLESAKLKQSLVTHSDNTILPIDIATLLKVLPRIQGSHPALATLLEGLELVLNRYECFFSVEKVRAMQRQLRDYGFATFF